MRMNQAPTHFTLTVAPAKVIRGSEALTQAGEASQLWAVAPVVGGDRTLPSANPACNKS